MSRRLDADTQRPNIVPIIRLRMKAVLRHHARSEGRG